MITPEDIARLFVPPTETPEQLKQKRLQLDQQIRSMDLSNPDVEPLKMDYMLLSAYLRLDNIANVRMGANILNATTLSSILAQSSLGARFVRLGETIITFPSISGYSHAQYSSGVFGLRRPDDAGSLDPRPKNLLLLSGGSSSIGILENNDQRPFTVSLIARIGKAANPSFEVRAVNEG